MTALFRHFSTGFKPLVAQGRQFNNVEGKSVLNIISRIIAIAATISACVVINPIDSICSNGLWRRILVRSTFQDCFWRTHECFDTDCCPSLAGLRHASCSDQQATTARPSSFASTIAVRSSADGCSTCPALPRRTSAWLPPAPPGSATVVTLTDAARAKACSPRQSRLPTRLRRLTYLPPSSISSGSMRSQRHPGEE